MIKTAVIIVGGEGSRLRPLTEDRPKTLVEVGGKPVLYRIIQWVKSYGINHIVLGVAYKKEKIYEYMKENDNFGLKVDFSEHTVEGGTAQAFKLAIDRFVNDDVFLAMNGDELTNMDISKMFEKHKLYNPYVTMALAPFDCRFSVVGIGDDPKITGFEYGKKLQNIPVSIGVYIFSSEIRHLIPASGSIEDLVFTKLAKEGKMVSHMLADSDDWISINSIKDIEEATEKLKRRNTE